MRINWGAIIQIFAIGLAIVLALFAIVFIANWEPVTYSVLDNDIIKTNWGATIWNSIVPASWTFLGLIPVGVAEVGMLIE